MNRSIDIETERILSKILKNTGDKYRFKETIGQGGFAKLYLLHHNDLDSEITLKVLDADYIFTILKKNEVKDLKEEYEIYKKRFRNEAKLFAKIHHSNVVTVLDSDSVMDDELGIEVPYFFMQFLKGENLKKVLNKNGPLSFEIIQKISSDILEALAALHNNNIIHRDIKPDNIIIEEKQNIAMLLDFGLAKDLGSSLEITDSHIALGTPYYMAPEQFKDSSKVGPPTDIYSFGIVLFEMVTGRIPFRGGNSAFELMYYHINKPVPSIRKFRPDVPEHLENVIKKALAKEPRDRYKNAEEFLASLQKQEESNQNPRNKWKLISIAIILSSILICLLYWFLVPQKNQSSDSIPIEQVTKQPTGNSAEESKKQDVLASINSGFEELEKLILKEEYSSSVVSKFELIKEKILQSLKILSEEKKLFIKTKIKKTETKFYGNYLKKVKLQITSDISSNRLNDARNKLGTMKKKIPKNKYKKDIEDLDKIIKKAEQIPPSVRALQQILKGNLKMVKTREGTSTWTATFQIETEKSNAQFEMIYIPKDSFFIGKGDYKAADTVKIGDFWISETELSNKQYNCIQKSMSCQDEYKLARANDVNEYPIVRMSATKAKKICHKLSCILNEKYGKKNMFTFKPPTISQWIASARGPRNDNIFPWIKDGDTTHTKSGLMPVHSYEDGKSYYGLLHTYGNASEICTGRNGFHAMGGDCLKSIDNISSDENFLSDENYTTSVTGFRLCLIIKEE